MRKKKFVIRFTRFQGIVKSIITQEQNYIFYFALIYILLITSSVMLDTLFLFLICFWFLYKKILHRIHNILAFCILFYHIGLIFQELKDLREPDSALKKSFREIQVDDNNMLLWHGLIVPVSQLH